MAHEEVQKLIFEHCNPFEKALVGLAIGALDYKAGEFFGKNADALKQSGIIDADGKVDLECAEHALLSLEWPQAIGQFKFDKADAEKVMSRIKERAK